MQAQLRQIDRPVAPSRISPILLLMLTRLGIAKAFAADGFS